jgi:NitT/TauT family transport system ATP-binding protein
MAAAPPSDTRPEADLGQHGRLRIEGLHIQFTKPDGTIMRAVDDFNLETRTGEFICLVGPSGCGKSTTLRAVAGLQETTSGSIHLNGKPVLGPGRERCMVFQEYALFPWYTAGDNVAYGLRLQRRPKKERHRVAADWLARVGLQGYDQHYPSELSGGMRQRVAIARALAIDPEVLLMDEPFGALDAQTRAELQTALLQIWEQSQKTTIFVTHSIEEAVYLADRILVMASNPGRVVREIRVDMPRPRSKLSSEFNDYEGEVESCLRHDGSGNGTAAAGTHEAF